ncbi:MAG: FAD-dependent oxidoreductase, partial [Moorellales bacterium]
MRSGLLEPAREVEVYAQADVVVAGGGPAGTAAAVAAARNGARVLLLERYGHLGGMATGGMVILIPHLSHGSQVQELAGLNQEWLERLDRYGGAFHPAPEEIGSADPVVVARWRKYFSCVVEGRVRQSAYVDPEVLKIVLNEMVEEAGVTVCLHSWACRALVEDNRVIGVIFESKEGRKAVLGRVVIDCTGDGDIFATAGCEYEAERDPSLRSSNLAVVFRVGGVNFDEWAEFALSRPEKAQAIRNRLQEIAGFRILPHISNRNDICWFNNWVPGDCLTVRDLTRVEFQVRKAIFPVLDYMRREAPGFRNAYLLDTAPQIGTRGSRRVKGEYRLTMEDLKQGKTFEDTVALIPSLDPTVVSTVIHFPYRALVPKDRDGLLVAGRCFSSDVAANDFANLIPHCVAMGEAAGTAAALAVKSGVEVRFVDVPGLIRT